jgi:hypothetical protein
VAGSLIWPACLPITLTLTSHYHLKLHFSINSNCYVFCIGMEVYYSRQVYFLICSSCGCEMSPLIRVFGQRCTSPLLGNEPRILLEYSPLALTALRFWPPPALRATSGKKASLGFRRPAISRCKLSTATFASSVWYLFICVVVSLHLCGISSSVWYLFIHPNHCGSPRSIPSSYIRRSRRPLEAI